MATEVSELIAKLSLDNARFKKQLQEARAKLKDFGDQAEDSGDQAKQGFEKAEKGAAKLQKDLSSLKGLVAGVFTAGALIDFGKAVVNTTAEFQKMEAVLANTLGSSSNAQTAMKQIVAFASKTPYQVNELTDAFVKLANRGFIPTMEQMTSMGDLASSVGKSFDQLAEAVLDAQSGEFERLKEFGIKSKQEGDKVIFTFKGISTEVQKTDTAIQDYLISLGKLEGVAGAMESISKTTGGLLSNLADNITGLFKDIGDSSSGFINWFIKDLNRVITSIRFMSETIEGLNPFTNIAEKSEDFRKFLLTISEATTDAGLAYKDFASTFDKVDLKKLLGDTKFRELFIKTLRDEGESLEDAQSLWNSYIGIRKKAFDDEQKLNSLKKDSTSKTTALSEEEKKRIEDSKKFYDSTIQYSIKYQDQLKAEYSAINLITEAKSKLQKVSESLAKSLEPAKAIDVGINLDGYSPVVSQEDLEIIKQGQAEVDKFNKQVALTQSIAGMLGNTFQSAFEGMLNTGKISFKGIIDGLKALIIKLIAAAGAALALNVLLGGIGLGGAKFGGMEGFKALFSSMSGIPKFAEGGMVTGLTTAILGDNPSGKEAVIPFEKMGSFLAQYGNGVGNMKVEVVGRIAGEDIYFSGINYTNNRNKLIAG
jgi:hypothetical protein